jgi:REP element-mobilizing transposase RayT
LTYNPEIHHRRSIRLREYDYAQAGAYFVTICTHDRLCLFGEIVDGMMKLNQFGEIVSSCWEEIPRYFDNVELDAFVVMPNHVHGIVVITGGTTTHVGATHASPLRMNVPSPSTHASPLRMNIPSPSTHGSPLPMDVPSQSKNVSPAPQPPRGPKRQSLGAIVGSFKSAVTKRINEDRRTTNRQVWQRNYYEHIIRNEKALETIRRYIINNPAMWEHDTDNPVKTSVPRSFNREVLAQRYGFTDEEADFINNYDIKYRMGKELDAEE